LREEFAHLKKLPALWTRSFFGIKERAVGARILVNDDTQEILLDLFDDLLSEEGYEVVLYSFAIQGQAVRQRRFTDRGAQRAFQERAHSRDA
jgi:hypothetical protein